MTDKVTLKLQSRADIRARLTNLHQTDTHTYYGEIGNMKVKHSIDWFRLEGSLAKYLQGENITVLTRQGVKAAIEKLEKDTGLDLRQAVVCGVEVGASIILKDKPHEYLRLFDGASRMKRQEVSGADGIETVNYCTETGAYRFTAYDKTKEAQQKKINIPELFQGKNVLRLEWKITKPKGIAASLKEGLTAHDLYDHETYRRLQALFFKAYKGIKKTGRIVFVDTAKSITPAKLQSLQAERYRQSCPKEHAAYLQTLRESGALSDKSAERIRAAERRAGRDYTISDKSPLIAELDAKVMAWALNGA
jgi:hypothetical protein